MDFKSKWNKWGTNTLFSLIVVGALWGTYDMVVNNPEREKIKKEKLSKIERVYEKAMNGDNNFSFDEKKSLLKALDADVPLDSSDKVTLSPGEKEGFYGLGVGSSLFKSQNIYTFVNEKKIDNYLEN